jgi:hypothetical protein
MRKPWILAATHADLHPFGAAFNSTCYTAAALEIAADHGSLSLRAARLATWNTWMRACLCVLSHQLAKREVKYQCLCICIVEEHRPIFICSARLCRLRADLESKTSRGFGGRKLCSSAPSLVRIVCFLGLLLSSYHGSMQSFYTSRLGRISQNYTT